MPRHEGAEVQDARKGVGPVYQRRYRVRISGSPMDATQLIKRLAEDLNAASPVEVAVFDKVSGPSGTLEPGDEYVVHMPGPWNCPVRVVERTPESFRFVTLQGHLEAGQIEFRAEDTPEGDVVFTIESWARSGDRVAELLYARVGIAKEMQLHMWTHFCSRVAALSGGDIVGDVTVETERAEVGQDRGRLTRVLAAPAAHAFSLVGRLRGGRPLHPRGLVADAALDLHGTSRYWGVPLLDATVDVRGEARLSRAAGLPPPLPDVLGLALRWPQPEEERESARGSGDGAGETGMEGTAELLLATTGSSLPGRRLLRPRRTWSPAFYGSLLPYRAGDRRVLIGALARGPRVPAGLDALARALDEGPLPFDLVVATEFGAWERFGELVLTGPARGDDEAGPARFDPAARPIRDLPPSGLLQRLRGPIYAAVQSADRRSPSPRHARGHRR